MDLPPPPPPPPPASGGAARPLPAPPPAGGGIAYPPTARGTFSTSLYPTTEWSARATATPTSMPRAALAADIPNSNSLASRLTMLHMMDGGQGDVSGKEGAPARSGGRSSSLGIGASKLKDMRLGLRLRKEQDEIAALPQAQQSAPRSRTRLRSNSVFGMMLGTEAFKNGPVDLSFRAPAGTNTSEMYTMKDVRIDEDVYSTMQRVEEQEGLATLHMMDNEHGRSAAYFSTERRSSRLHNGIRDAGNDGNDGNDGDDSGSKDDNGSDEGSKETPIPIELNEFEESLQSCIVSEVPDVSWSDVCGLRRAKEQLKEAVVLPIKYPQLFTGKRQPWRAILLYGPPGTGKSFLAKAVATESASTFFSVSSSDLVSKFQGESEKLVRALFEVARKRRPSTVFIDEIDSLCSARSAGEGDSSKRIKTEFLVQMQGVGKVMDGVLVLGATNDPGGLDPAMRRRFQKKIYISLPDHGARIDMLKVHLADTPHSVKDENFELLALQTNGFSGDDIKNVVRDAIMMPLREALTATSFRRTNVAEDVNEMVTDGAKPSSSKSSSSPRVSEMWVPCAPGERGSISCTIDDLPTTEVQCAPVSLNHFVAVLQRSKPSVGKAELAKYRNVSFVPVCTVWVFFFSFF